MKNSLLSGILGGFMILGPHTASSHIVMADGEARAGYQEVLSLVVPHGCGPNPTTEVRLKIPDGVSIAMPEDKDGWQTEVIMRELETPIPIEGGFGEMTEVVDQFVWKGGSIPVDRLGTFTFLARLPDAPGSVVYFKTIQVCGDVQEAWIETADEGAEIYEIFMQDRPAPFVELLAPRRPQLGLTVEEFFQKKMESNPSGMEVQ